MIIYSQGKAEVTIPANEKIAVFSNSSVKISQRVGYPNFPDSWDEIEVTSDGEVYTSAAFAAGATLLVQASAADAFYEVGSAPVIGEPSADLSAGATPWVLAGLAAAQGGAVTLKGGTSSTTGNAGGAANLTGGQAGATGVGGAATVAAAAGGATSGNGGVGSVAGGAGTASNATGGVGKTVGGAGQGSAAGGAGQVTGGVGGATGAGGAAEVTGGAGGATSGKGGAAKVTGGAGSNGNASGGSVIHQPGAKNGSGLDGGVFNRGTTQFKKAAVPGTSADSATLTVAQMLAGMLAATPTAAAAYTMPTGTDLTAACPTDLAAGDSFDLTIYNLGGAGDDITLTASTDITIVGDPVVTVAVPKQGTFRLKFMGTVTWIAYRVG